MSIFDKLFGAKKMKTGKPITLNLHEGGFELNGQTFAFPASASELIKVLGEPRKVEIDYTDNVRKGLSEDYGIDFDSFHPMRYYWDDFGIEGKTCDQENIHDIMIFFGKSKYPLPPTKCAFYGTLLFDGQPWQEIVLKKGYGGVHRFENSIVAISVYGNKTKEKNVKVMEWMLKTKASEELKQRIREKNGMLSFDNTEKLN